MITYILYILLWAFVGMVSTSGIAILLHWADNTDLVVDSDSLVIAMFASIIGGFFLAAVFFVLILIVGVCLIGEKIKSKYGGSPLFTMKLRRKG